MANVSQDRNKDVKKKPCMLSFKHATHCGPLRFGICFHLQATLCIKLDGIVSMNRDLSRNPRSIELRTLTWQRFSRNVYFCVVCLCFWSFCGFGPVTEKKDGSVQEIRCSGAKESVIKWWMALLTCNFIFCNSIWINVTPQDLMLRTASIYL